MKFKFISLKRTIKLICWLTQTHMLSDIWKNVSVFCFDNCVAVIYAMFMTVPSTHLFTEGLKFYSENSPLLCQFKKTTIKNNFIERTFLFQSEVKIGATENMTCCSSASSGIECWKFFRDTLLDDTSRNKNFHHQFMLLLQACVETSAVMVRVINIHRVLSLA